MGMLLPFGVVLLILVSMVTVGESFLRIPSEESENEEKIEIHVHVGKREKRSINNRVFPVTFDLNFILDGSPIHMHLQENPKIHTNVEVLALNKGSIIRRYLNDEEESILYQDVNRGAVFVVQRNQAGKTNVFGFLQVGKNDIVLQSDEDITNGESISKFNVIRQPLKVINFSDSDTVNSVKEPKTETWHSRRRKRATGDYSVELLIVVDYSVYKYWYDSSKATSATEKEKDALEKIKQFYAFVINGMDAMYKTIQTSSYTISVVYAGIVIAQTANDSPGPEETKKPGTNPVQIEADDALTKFSAWFQGKSNLPGHDHAMLFTRYDMWGRKDDKEVDIAGLATQNGVCTNKKQSIVEDHFEFSLVAVAAHELGHSLSAQHDGLGNACKSEDKYIMSAALAPATDDPTALNQWKFSLCSTDYFTIHLDAIGTSSSHCLKTFDPAYNASALSRFHGQLPGQVYNADEQCKRIYGTGSYFCNGAYKGNFATICTTLWCVYVADRDRCIKTYSADGTTCGNKKWCKAGVCTYDARAPPGDESCLYGDKKGTVLKSGETCAEAIAKYPLLCIENVNFKKDCCASCAPPTTTVTPTTRTTQTTKTTKTTPTSKATKTTPTTKTTKTTPTTKTTKKTPTTKTTKTTPTARTTPMTPTTRRRFGHYYRYRRLFRHRLRRPHTQFFRRRLRFSRQRRIHNHRRFYHTHRQHHSWMRINRPLRYHMRHF